MADKKPHDYVIVCDDPTDDSKVPLTSEQHRKLMERYEETIAPVLRAAKGKK